MTQQLWNHAHQRQLDPQTIHCVTSPNLFPGSSHRLRTRSSRSSEKHFTWSRKEMRTSVISWRVECKSSNVDVQYFVIMWLCLCSCFTVSVSTIMWPVLTHADFWLISFRILHFFSATVNYDWGQRSTLSLCFWKLLLKLNKNTNVYNFLFLLLPVITSI